MWRDLIDWHAMLVYKSYSLWPWSGDYARAFFPLLDIQDLLRGNSGLPSDNTINFREESYARE
jgi:hypothetical protein